MILYDKILIGFLLGAALLLYGVAILASKQPCNKWRLGYLVPAVVTMLLIAVAGWEWAMLGVYLGAVLLLVGFIKDHSKIRKWLCGIAVVLSLLTPVVCTNSKGYRAVDYVGDFKEGFAAMKAHYILAEHKGIDWDDLYDTYLPLFEEANKNHDPVANVTAWRLFTAEFHDGHVAFSSSDEDLLEQSNEQVGGNDYGLSLMPLASGEMVAVNVEPNAFFTEAGIHNGTVITSWDGREITQVAEESLAYRMSGFSDRDTEAFWKPLFAAGVGGETVKITYITDAGQEKEVTLSRLGTYDKRLLSTAEILDRGVETGHMMWQEVSEEAVVFRLKMMMFDSESAQTENYTAMQADIRKKAKEYQEQGKTHLILDLRSNGGGSGQMVKALASLFAPVGEHYYCTDGLWDDVQAAYARDAETGKYIPAEAHYFRGEQIWNGPITILVNSGSASASDHLVAVMRGMEQVTIMGFTESNGCAQGIGTVALQSGGLCFSSALLLDANGEIFIDSGVDGESGNDIDVRVPLNQEAVRVLFDEGDDYLLQQCLQYAQ